MDDKVRYINEFANTKVYKGPRFLYKYRPLDDYAFDMLSDNYLYLCQAKRLDDPMECVGTIDFDKYYDLETNNLKRECVRLIIESIRPYTSEENNQLVQSTVSSIVNRNGTIRPNFLLDCQSTLQELLPRDFDLAQFTNSIIAIPEKLDSPEVKPHIFNLIKMMYSAREELGICSLSANKNDKTMWEEYADNGSGYCVEYDLDGYENLDLLLPVIYVAEGNRETDITTRILLSFIGNMIKGFSNGSADVDVSQCVTLLLTKYDKWEYQNEWRLLGDADTKIKAPKVNAIYLGKCSNGEYLDRIIELANSKGIEIRKGY